MDGRCFFVWKLVDSSWSCTRAPHEPHQFASRRCPWTALNYRTEEQQANFASKRRRERAMFKLLIPSSWAWQLKILIWSSFGNGQLVVLVGKNHGFCGWKSFFRIKVARGSELEYDGCRYGLRLSYRWISSKFLTTTSEKFNHIYKAKTCTGWHEHEWRQGFLSLAHVSLHCPDWEVWTISRTTSTASSCSCHTHDDWGRVLVLPWTLWSRARTSSQWKVFHGSSDRSKSGIEQWKVHMLNYHRSSGLPSTYNLARILRDAGRPAWQVNAALDLHCDEWAASKLGGISSGRI